VKAKYEGDERATRAALDKAVSIKKRAGSTITEQASMDLDMVPTPSLVIPHHHSTSVS
jgi:hypothetical protein